MSDSCTHCDQQVRPRQEALQCEQCQRWQHRTCNSGITRDQYRQAVKGTLQLDWICCQCQMETDEPEKSIVVDVPFNVPEPVVENSLLEEPLQDVAQDLNPSKQYHIVDDGSTRGKRKLVDNDGFSYTVKKQTGDHILWRCSKRSKTLTCPATVISDGDTYRPGLKVHVHPGEPGSHIAIKIKAEEVLRLHADPTAPPASRPNPSSLVRTGNRQRLGTRPADPANLESDLDLDFLDQATPDFLRRDLLVGDRRHIVFYTDRQLQLLAAAKTWYMDGTFRVVSDPWVQLFSIHAFVKSDNNMKQIPLVFCVMSGKRKEDYYEVLRFIDHRLPEHIALHGFVADFEAGLWLALRQRFPQLPIQGCVFHWTQAVFRKVQEHGLQTAYNQRDEVYCFLRQVMALPFLPPEHIQETFMELDRRAPDAIVPVMDYIYSTWITSTVFNVNHWSVFMSSVRTNNDVEGWHNRFNGNVVTRGKVPFYFLVTELFAEASDIPLQLRLVSEGKLQRYQRKKYRQLQGQIFSLWERYVRRDISASQLLRQCGLVYGPPAQ